MAVKYSLYSYKLNEFVKNWNFEVKISLKVYSISEICTVNLTLSISAALGLCKQLLFILSSSMNADFHTTGSICFTLQIVNEFEKYSRIKLVGCCQMKSSIQQLNTIPCMYFPVVVCI